MDESIGFDIDGAAIHEGDTILIIEGKRKGEQGRARRGGSHTVYVMIGPEIGIGILPHRVRVIERAARALVQ
jgi:hypothetical protein